MSDYGPETRVFSAWTGVDDEPMTDQEGSKRWKQVEGIVRQLEPQIIELFRQSDVPPNDASIVLEDVVTLLLYRWEEVSRPEAWVLEMVRNRLIQLKESE